MRICKPDKWHGVTDVANNNKFPALTTSILLVVRLVRDRGFLKSRQGGSLIVSAGSWCNVFSSFGNRPAMVFSDIDSG